MSHLDADVRATKLLAPVRELVDRALNQIPGGATLTVCVGGVAGFSKLVGHTLVLSEALDGPELSHPDETDLVAPLDRWRRAAGCVIEAACALYLADVVKRSPGDDWPWVGSCIDMADGLAPALELALPDLALALHTGDPGSHPRAGVAVMRAWKAAGHDPWQRVRYVLDDGVVSAQEWLTLGAWVFHPERGLAAQLSQPVARPPRHDVPLSLGPWRWALIEVPAHPRGGQIVVEGDGKVANPWGVGGAPLRTLAAAAAGGCQLGTAVGGPSGSWDVASAQGFGQVMGARGVRFDFRPSGALEIVLADAFVGPLAAVAMAEEIGTSGTAHGSWSVAGPQRLRFSGIAALGLTMHSRRDRFMVPATGFGLGEWLQALEEGAWAWKAVDDRLFFRGKMLGGMVEIRFRRAP